MFGSFCDGEPAASSLDLIETHRISEERLFVEVWKKTQGDSDDDIPFFMQASIEIDENGHENQLR